VENPGLATLLLYVAANVRRLRDKRGLTQEALAERAGLALRYLQDVEAAKSNISLSVLLGIADGLGVPPRDLLRPAEMPEVKRGRPRKARDD